MKTLLLISLLLSSGANQRLVTAAYEYIHRNAQVSGCIYQVDEASEEFSDKSYKVVYTLYCQLHHPRKYVVEAIALQGDAVGIKVSEITAPSGVRIE